VLLWSLLLNTLCFSYCFSRYFPRLYCFLLECELLAFLFIIIYVGAIACFLFAIMMLESKLNNLSKNTMKYIPIGLVFGTLFFYRCCMEYQWISIIHTRQFYFHTYTNWYDLIDSVTDVEVYGQVLYIFCAAIFAGLILLLVLIG
jgi:NADH-quinone oxidoreductase subunit J